MKKCMLAILLIVGIILTGCIPTAIPGTMPRPAERTVDANEIVGTWKFDTSTLFLGEDGRFSITGPTRYTGGGTWKLDEDNRLYLHYEYPYSGVRDGWYIVEPQKAGYSRQKYGDLAVYGGTDDPDYWRPFERGDLSSQ